MSGTLSLFPAIDLDGGRVVRLLRGERSLATAYEGVSRISFDGMHYRRDIGRKAVGASGI